MNELRFEEIEMMTTPLGEQTDYPDLNIAKDLHANLKLCGIDEKLYFGFGRVDNILPYKIRESYTRERKIRKVKTAVLESDGLRAVFLTEYGCRLWSLYDKRENRELLYSNPVLQFGNLAVRNAWFAGGVEWNVGFIGHSPLTCEKMFCEKVIDADTGSPVLRFYEYERIRGVVYEVDAYISEKYNQLMIRVRIKNCHDREIPMYWWSNIAVPETLDTRIVVDADAAYIHAYGGGLAVTPIPYSKNTDVTYSAIQQDATDYFFRVPDQRQKFISALDRAGSGLIQSSTKRLKGRKLFVWGVSAGGRKWQEFLAKPAYAYAEIQAGLARTQTECLPMPAGEEWEWIESYGYMKADPEKVHSDDWEAAKSEVRTHLIPESYLESELSRTRKSVVGVRGEVLQNGSGWAYIESVRREMMGENRLIDGIVFDDGAVDCETRPWFELLKNGTFEVPSAPQKCGYMIQKEYIPLIEKATEKHGENWFAHLHLGVCYYANRDFKKASEHFSKSVGCEENPLALACASHIEKANGNIDGAIELLMRAYRLDSDSYGLAKRIMMLFIENSRYEQCIEFYRNLCDELKANGRMIFYYAKSLLSVGNIAEFEKILDDRFVVNDLKECEVSLYELWVDYCKILIDKNGEDYGDDITAYIKQKYQVPKWLNFNMRS